MTEVSDATYYFESGKLKGKGKFIGQGKDSLWTYYNEEGKVISTETYVKGKKEGVNVYTALCEYRPEWQIMINRHAVFLSMYRKQMWDDAIEWLATLRGAFDGSMDSYYDIMRDRISDLRDAGLSAGWDGVYVATSK